MPQQIIIKKPLRITVPYPPHEDLRIPNEDLNYSERLARLSSLPLEDLNETSSPQSSVNLPNSRFSGKYNLGLSKGLDNTDQGLSLLQSYFRQKNENDPVSSVWSKYANTDETPTQQEIQKPSEPQIKDDVYPNSALGYVPFSQSEYGQNLIDQMNQYRMNAIEKQNADIEAAKEQLKNYLNKEEKIDFSPIAALTDAWTGHNMAKYFKDDSEKNKELALELQREILKNQGNIIGSETDWAKDRMNLGYDESKTLADLLRHKYASDIQNKLGISSAEAKAEQERLNRENAIELQKMKDKEAYRRALLNQKSGNTGLTPSQQFAKDQRDLDFKFKVENKYNETVAPKMNGLVKFKKEVSDLKNYLESLNSNDIPLNDTEYKRLASSLIGTYNNEKAHFGQLTGSDYQIIINDLAQSIGPLDIVWRNKTQGGKPTSIKGLNKLLEGSDFEAKNIDSLARKMSSYDLVKNIHEENMNIYNRISASKKANFDQDVLDYAKKHNISPEEAQKYKDSYKGGK